MGQYWVQFNRLLMNRFILTFLLSISPVLLLAEESAYTLKCSFPTAVSKQGKKTQEFGFQILMDMSEESIRAFIIGGNGTEPLMVVPGAGSFTFIERTSAGNVMTTTFMIDTGEAVHSRHTVFMGQHLKLATQSYGTCQ